MLEQSGDQIMNCATYFDADGRLAGVYRKIHLTFLFDEYNGWARATRRL